MSITINAKGTSNQTFSVGKNGLVLHNDGSLNPPPAGYLYLDSLRWPSTDGTDGQFLKTNGSGILSWGTASGTGTVTSVSGTGTVSGLSLSGTVTTSGNLTLGGTLAVTPDNFSSQAANTFLAAPNGTSGVPTFRTIVAADIPTLNQNTTGSAGLNVLKAGDTMTGNLNFSGTGLRITGDLSSNTVNDRLAFQTTTTNAYTAITAIPNGTNTSAYVQVFGSSDTANSPYGQLGITSSSVNILSSKLGAGTDLPLTINVAGSERLKVDTNGYVGVGTNFTPARLFHIQSNNGLIRLDRDANTVGLQMHRFPTGDFTTPWKGFLIGVEASSSGVGNFLIADYGTAVSGAATNRLLIDSVGRFQIIGPQDGNITAVGALNIDCSTANYFTKTINGASTFTFSNAPSSKAFAFTLEINHTSGVITWPASVTWPGATAPNLVTSRVHLFSFTTSDGGTKWRGAYLTNYTI